MSYRHGVLVGLDHAVEDVEVGGAHTGGMNPNECLARPGLGALDIADLQTEILVNLPGLHRGHVASLSRSLPMTAAGNTPRVDGSENPPAPQRPMTYRISPGSAMFR